MLGDDLDVEIFILNLYLIKCFGILEEIVQGVLFLLLDCLSFMIGSFMIVDGVMFVWLLQWLFEMQFII